MRIARLFFVDALVLAAILHVVSLGQTVSAASAPRYDVHNEGLLDRLTRSVLRKAFSRSDEDITAGRIANDESLHPTFHPAVTRLSNVSLVDDVLAMPAPPQRRSAFSDDLPAQIAAHRQTSEERQKDWKVWVVLATASESDPLSRRMNAIFNATLSEIFPHAGGALPEVAAKATDSVKQIVTGGDEERGTVSRENDIERDEATRKAAHQRDVHIKAVSKAKKYNYAIVDFHNEPDLMWYWWIWKVPLVLFITPSTSPDRKYDVRFWKVAFVSGLNPEKMLTYIGHDLWLDRLDVWTSDLAPGGKKSHMTLKLARPSNWIYDKASKIPTWLVGMLATAVGTSVMKWLHSMDKKKKKEDKEGKEKQGKVRETASTSAIGGTPSAAAVKRQ